MRVFLLAGLAVILMLSCSSTVPPTLAPPVPAAAFLPYRSPLSPEGYLPPDACSAAGREGPWQGTTTWTYRCIVGTFEVRGLLQQLRGSAVGQGWRECGRAGQFAKGGLAMSLALDRDRRPGTPTPDSANREVRWREVPVVIVQWAMSSPCGEPRG